MKTIKGVIMDTETKEVFDTNVYIDVIRTKDGNRKISVVSIGSEDTSIQFTMKAYDLREAIRER